MTIAPPGLTQRAASAKKERGRARWWSTFVMTIARRLPSHNGMAWASKTILAPGVAKISDVIRLGMNSLRNPAPEPSSRTGPSHGGKVATMSPYHSS